jgi:hypothetical protein
VNTALSHRNADIALMPVPALLSLGLTRRRMLQVANARFGARFPERITTVLGIGKEFTGTLDELLDVVEAVYEATATA